MKFLCWPRQNPALHPVWQFALKFKLWKQKYYTGCPNKGDKLPYIRREGAYYTLHQEGGGHTTLHQEGGAYYSTSGGRGLLPYIRREGAYYLTSRKRGAYYPLSGGRGAYYSSKVFFIAWRGAKRPSRLYINSDLPSFYRVNI